MSQKITESLYCHNCRTYQPFEWDIEAKGKQIFYCPNCNHPHLRELTEDTRIKIAIFNPNVKMRCVAESNALPCDDSLIEYEYKIGHSIGKRWGSANNLPPGTKIALP